MIVKPSTRRTFSREGVTLVSKVAGPLCGSVSSPSLHGSAENVLLFIPHFYVLTPQSTPTNWPTTGVGVVFTMQRGSPGRIHVRINAMVDARHYAARGAGVVVHVPVRAALVNSVGLLPAVQGAANLNDGRNRSFHIEGVEVLLLLLHGVPTRARRPGRWLPSQARLP